MFHSLFCDHCDGFLFVLLEGAEEVEEEEEEVEEREREREMGRRKGRKKERKLKHIGYSMARIKII